MKNYLFWVIIIITANFTITQGQHPNPRTGIFLHHSTGYRIWGPNGSSTSVPIEIAKFNDSLNLANDSSKFIITEQNWPLDPWNNEWYRWHNIFNNQDSTADIAPILQDYEIVIIKSCFPSSAIVDRGTPLDTLANTRKSIYNYKWHWRNFIRKMEAHHNNFFVVWTNAPLVPNATNDKSAILSDQFCRWAKDTLALGLDSIYGSFPENVYVFDFFHKLAGPDGKLPTIYSASSTDSHPNSAATELVAPQFVREILNAAIKFETKWEISTPILRSPLDGENGVSLTPSLDWSNNPVATYYNLQISPKNDFDSILVNIQVTSSNYTVEENKLEYDSQYFWRVRAEDSIRTSDWSEIWSFKTTTISEVSDNTTNNKIPNKYELFQNYPNPFNPTTKINYALPENSYVKIQIINMLGQVIATLVNREANSGYYSVEWNAKDIPSGVYIYKIVAKGKSGVEFVNLKKMVLLK